MKRIIFILGAWLGFASIVYAQHSFQISFATEEYESVKNSIIDHEGNVILAGMIGSFSDSTVHGLILKITPDGTLQSKRMERKDTVSFFNEVILLDNGHYFVCGIYSAVGDIHAMDHFWIVIFDQNLEVVTERSYRLNPSYLWYGELCLAIINRNGEVAVVTTNEIPYNNSSFADYIMFRFSQQGDSLSSVLHTSPRSSMLNSFNSTPGNDSLMMIGRGVLNTGQESLNFMDLNMDITSVVNLGGTINGHSRYTNNNWLNTDEFLMTCDRVIDYDNGREYLFSVFRMNTSGQYLQELRLDRPDTLEYSCNYTNLVVAPDSLIYVGGFQSYNNISSTPSNCIIYLIDKDLNLIGRKSFGGDANYILRGIEATPDNGCFAYALRTNMLNRADYELDIVMWKFLREDFTIFTQLTDLPAAALNSKAWPNPADDVLHISLENLPQDSEFRLQIYNTAGQKYFDKALTASANSVQCHIGVLPAGNYVYQLQTASGKAGSGTFIKQ